MKRPLCSECGNVFDSPRCCINDEDRRTVTTVIGWLVADTSLPRRERNALLARARAEYEELHS